MDQSVPIYGRGSFPTLYVKLRELIRLVSSKLKEHSIEIRDIRLNGGATCYVLAPDNSHYNDLDLIFGTDLSDESQFDVIREVVIECLRELFVKQQTPSLQNDSSSYQMPLSNCAIKEAYVHKMVKVTDDDRWSLISLGVHLSEANCCGRAATCDRRYASTSMTSDNTVSSAIDGIQCENDNSKVVAQANDMSKNLSDYMICNHKQQQCRRPFHQQQQFPNSIELKFVDRMRRKFEFSVDSFQIILDSLIKFYDFAPQAIITRPSAPLACHQRQTKKISGFGARASSPFNQHHRCRVNANANSATNLPNSGSTCCECQRKLLLYSRNQHNQTGSNSKSFTMASAMCQTRSKYANQHQYPSMVSEGSQQSIPSEPSSSGCSSSSSVVSSSSSSLSYDDDDREYLDYCAVSSRAITPGPSSASTDDSTALVSAEQADFQAKEDLPGESSNEEVSSQADNIAELGEPMGARKRLSDDSSKRLATATTTGASSCESDASSICLDQKSIDYCADSIESLPDADASHSFCAVISENFYPTVIGRSEYGDFKEALYHLEKRLIATRNPEEIRGGGLLKYCNLLVKNYKPTDNNNIRTLERYMCSRFFIDFIGLSQQQAKLESYLANHFSDDPVLKFEYLTILHNVVQRSTVCLMNHDLRLTLNMIRDLAHKLNENQHGQQDTQRTQLRQIQQHQPPAAQQCNNKHPHQARDQQEQQEPQEQQQQQHHQQQQSYYEQQKPLVTIQSGLYRVRLVNYALVKPDDCWMWRKRY